MANTDPYQGVKADAERLTKARLAASNKGEAENNDLVLVPMVQATTPVDEQSKGANTGGVVVSGQPDAPKEVGSDGFVDGANTDPAVAEASSKKSSK